jgi:hypothetical protein
LIIYFFFKFDKIFNEILFFNLKFFNFLRNLNLNLSFLLLNDTSSKKFYYAKNLSINKFDIYVDSWLIIYLSSSETFGAKEVLIKLPQVRIKLTIIVSVNLG